MTLLPPPARRGGRAAEGAARGSERAEAGAAAPGPQTAGGTPGATGPAGGTGETAATAPFADFLTGRGYRPADDRPRGPAAPAELPFPSPATGHTDVVCAMNGAFLGGASAALGSTPGGWKRSTSKTLKEQGVRGPGQCCARILPFVTCLMTCLCDPALAVAVPHALRRQLAVQATGPARALPRGRPRPWPALETGQSRRPTLPRPPAAWARLVSNVPNATVMMAGQPSLLVFSKQDDRHHHDEGRIGGRNQGSFHCRV